MIYRMTLQSSVLELELIHHQKICAFIDPRLVEKAVGVPTRPNEVLEYLGSAAFSRAVQCLDLETNRRVGQPGGFTRWTTWWNWRKQRELGRRRGSEPLRVWRSMRSERWFQAGCGTPLQLPIPQKATFRLVSKVGVTWCNGVT